MNQNNVLRFHELHSFLTANGIVGASYNETQQHNFYCYLFLRDDKDPKNIIITDAQVSRWCDDGRKINNDILKAVASSPISFQTEFSGKLRRLLKEELDVPFPDEDKMEGALISAINRDYLRGGILLDESGKPFADPYDILACAFIEALTNDNIDKNVNIVMEKEILDADEQAKVHGHPLLSPYILKLFLDKGDSLLVTAVERLRPGLGDAVVNSINEYCKGYHGGPRPNWGIKDSDLFFYAKKYAFLQGYDKTLAGEKELLMSMLLTGSDTLNAIAAKVGGEQSLKEAIEQCCHVSTGPFQI